MHVTQIAVIKHVWIWRQRFSYV